jgi:transcriptional regulator
VDNTKPLRRRQRLPIFLTDDQVAEIRQRWAKGETQRALADEFGVTQSTVSRIVRAQRRTEPFA